MCCIPLTPHTVDPLLLITISNRNDIEQCGSDNRRPYRLLNGRLQRRKSPCLPANDNATYSVYTHWRYVLSLHSLALRTQSTLTGATYSCALDPLSTWLLKDVSDTLMPFLTPLANSPIASSFVPRCLKHPKFIPVLKKANLDHNNMNYRPISNLHFVSKLLE